MLHTVVEDVADTKELIKNVKKCGKMEECQNKLLLPEVTFFLSSCLLEGKNSVERQSLCKHRTERSLLINKASTLQDMER